MGEQFARIKPMSVPAENSPQFTKNWLMFLMKPADLLQLLNMISNPVNKFAAGALPPDVKIADVFYDEGQNYLGMMLESEWFEPVEVQMNGQFMQAAWPRAIFALDAAGVDEISEEELWSPPLEQDPTLADEPVPHFITALEDAATRDFRLRALTFSAADLLLILRTKNPRSLPVFPSFKEDTRVLGAISQEQIGSWTIFLEHPDFDPCKLGQENDLVHVEIPGQESDYTFRIGLPGATLKKRLDLNFDDVV